MLVSDVRVAAHKHDGGRPHRDDEGTLGWPGVTCWRLSSLERYPDEQRTSARSDVGSLKVWRLEFLQSGRKSQRPLPVRAALCGYVQADGNTTLQVIIDQWRT